MGASRWVGALVAAPLFLAAGNAVGGTAEAAERHVVRLEGGSPAAEAAIRELLERLGLRSTTGVARASETLAWVRVTAGERRAVVVRIFDGHGRERAARTLEGEAAIVDEELAHVVQATVEELERSDEPPPIATAPSPPGAPRPMVAVSAGVFGAAMAFSGGATGGAGIDLSFKYGNVRLVADGNLWAPVSRSSTGDGDVRSEVALRTAHLAALVTVAEHGRFSVAAGPSVGVGWVGAHTEASEIDPGRVATRRAATSALVGLRGTGYASFGKNLSIFLSILGDFDTSPHRIVEDNGATRTALFETGTFRPSAALGLEVRFDADSKVSGGSGVAEVFGARTGNRPFPRGQ